MLIVIKGRWPYLTAEARMWSILFIAPHGQDWKFHSILKDTTLGDCCQEALYFLGHHDNYIHQPEPELILSGGL